MINDSTKKLNEVKEKRSKFKVPHAYVIISILLMIVSIATYFIPAGIYEKIEDPVTGRMIVNAEVFNYVEKTPVPLWDIPAKIVEALSMQSKIIFAVIIIGGTFEVLLSTGMFHAFSSRLTRKFAGKEKILIPGFVALFCVLGITLSTTKFIGFAPIGVLLAVSLGYDAIVGVAMVLLGVGVGFSTGVLAPTTAIAQEIAGLPAYSGIGLRLVSFVLFGMLTTIYIMRYAKKVKNNPEFSYVYGLQLAHHDDKTSIDDLPTIEKKHYIVLLVVIAAFSILMYGCVKYGWGLTENAILFIWLTIIAGLAYGYNPSEIAQRFIKGTKTVTGAALIIGLGATVKIILRDANILDSVVRQLAVSMHLLPLVLRAPAMMISQCVVNVFVTSGSGQAAITMPVMVPLADISGISRQTAVLAFKFGDGFTNYVLPHGAALMGFLGATGVPYDRWLKFAGKLYLLWIALGSGILIFATVINYT